MTREIEGGKEMIESTLPLVAGCQEPIAEWKIPNMRGIMSARTKPLNVINTVDVKMSSEIISYETPASRGNVKLVPADESGKLISLLHTEARVI